MSNPLIGNWERMGFKKGWICGSWLTFLIKLCPGMPWFRFQDSRMSGRLSKTPLQLSLEIWIEMVWLSGDGPLDFSVKESPFVLNLDWISWTTDYCFDNSTLDFTDIGKHFSALDFKEFPPVYLRFSLVRSFQFKVLFQTFNWTVLKWVKVFIKTVTPGVYFHSQTCEGEKF